MRIRAWRWLAIGLGLVSLACKAQKPPSARPATSSQPVAETQRRGLSFHVVARPSDVEPDRLTQLERRLAADGPATGPTTAPADESFRWLPVGENADLHRLSPWVITSQDRDGRRFLLVWDTPARSMTRAPGRPAWRIKRAYPTVIEGGTTVVGVEFDQAGGELLRDVSGNNVGRPLAIVIDGVVIAAPTIRTRIASHVVIDAGGKGFTQQEAHDLARQLER